MSQTRAERDADCYTHRQVAHDRGVRSDTGGSSGALGDGFLLHPFVQLPPIGQPAVNLEERKLLVGISLKLDGHVFPVSC